MSEHRIDDIFKKVLTSQHHELDPSDWQGAREMLGLKKKKRRLPLWLWVGTVAAIFLLTRIVFTVWEKETAVENPLLAEGSGQIELDNGLWKENKEAIDLNEEKLSTTKAVDPSSLAEITETIKSNQSDATAYKSSSIISNLKIIKEPLFSKSIQINNDALVVGKNETLQLATNKNIADLNHPKESIPLLKNSVSLETIFILDPIQIELLMVPDFDIRIADIGNSRISVLDPELAQGMNFSWGMYTGVYLSELTPQLGLFGDLNFNDHFFLSAGVGINYEKGVSVTREGTVDAVSSNGVGIELLAQEQVVSDLLNIEIPFSIGYVIGRHRLFGGALWDYPLYSKSSIESELSLDVDVSIAMDPLTQVPEPVVSQKSSLTNARDLKQINTRLRIGYGYDFSKRFRLEAIGTYKLSSASLTSSSITRLSSFTPAIDDEGMNQNRFGGNITLKIRLF